MPDAAGLHYEWHGRDDAEPLILSPGLGGSAGFWTPNLATLTKTHRVLLYDHRGTGRSDRTLPDRVSVADMANDIAAVMDAVGVPTAHVMGHAAGAVAGLSLALDAPDRVRSLVIVNGWYRPDAHFARCFDLRLAALESGGANAWIRAQPIFLYPPAWIAEQQAALDADFEVQRDHFPGAESVRKRVAALRDFDVADRLGGLRVPTLAYAAKDDMLVPYTNSCELSLRSPGIELRLVEWGAHAVNVTARELFEWEVAHFLAQHPIRS